MENDRPAKSNRSTNRILIVSDCMDTRVEVLRHFLRTGLRVATASPSGLTRQQFLLHAGFDLVLLDRRGRSVSHRLVRRLRRMLPDVPILAIITDGPGNHVLDNEPGGALSGGLTDCPANGLSTEPVANDQITADDQITAPWSLDELTARVRTLLDHGTPERSPRGGAQAAYHLTIDPSTRSCYCRGQSIPLTDREFDILKVLFTRRGQTVSRETLAEQVWGEPEAVLPRTIDRHVAYIRRKIEENPAAPVYLHTVYGEGYRLTPTQQPRSPRQ